MDMMRMPEPVLSLVSLRCADPERAAAFYAALGLSVSRDESGDGPAHCVVSVGSISLRLYPLEALRGSVGARLGFMVGNLAAVLSAVAQTGGQVLREPHATASGLRAVLADPDGHRVELTQQPA